MTPAETMELLADMKAIWPHRQIDRRVVNVWTDAMSSLEYDQARRAVRELMRTERWFPSPAQVVELCRSDSSLPSCVVYGCHDVACREPGDGQPGDPNYPYCATHYAGWARSHSGREIA